MDFGLAARGLAWFHGRNGRKSMRIRCRSGSGEAVAAEPACGPREEAGPRATALEQDAPEVHCNHSRSSLSWLEPVEHLYS